MAIPRFRLPIRAKRAVVETERKEGPTVAEGGRVTTINKPGYNKELTQRGSGYAIL